MHRQFKENKDNNYNPLANPSKISCKFRNQTYIIDNETAFFCQTQQASSSSKQGHSKLLQLTSQCINYFNRFVVEKDIHFNIIHKAFSQLKGKVEQAFIKIIQQAQRKSQEICSFLLKEQNRLLQQKKNQQQTLRNLLKQIQQVHLARLLGQQQSSEELLTSYAQTLQSFFNVMMQVQRSSFQDNLQECVNFINNLVKEQLRMIVEQKFPRKLNDFIITNPNEQNYFTFDQGIPNAQEPTDSFLDNISPPNQSELTLQIKNIKQKQMTRAKNLLSYEQALTPRNPFRGIRLNNE